MIAFENVDVFYGRRQALSKVTCTIGEGAVGLLGPNGAGKSTFMKSLLGFVKPSAGRITAFGHVLPEGFLDVRQKLGYMPEREVVSPRISAVSFLTYCGCLCGMTRVDARERAHEVLNYVGMGENRYRPTQTYSTGMLQRVKFASALIHDPKLLLLDEPTNGLDPDGRIEMLDLIRELPRKREISIILSSHLLPDVEYVCDRLIMIKNGVIVRDGERGEITKLREGQFELRVRDNSEAFARALEQRGCTVSQNHNGNLTVQKPGEIDEKLFFEAAHACNTQIRHFRPLRYSIEEAFMQAVGAGSK